MSRKEKFAFICVTWYNDTKMAHIGTNYLQSNAWKWKVFV